MSEKKAKGDRKSIKEELAEDKLVCTITFSSQGVRYEHDPGLRGDQLIGGLRSVIDSIMIQSTIAAFEHKMANAQMLAKKGLLKQ